MVTFLQILVLVLMLFLLSATFNRFRKQKIRLLAFILWSGVWIGVLIMAFVPGLMGGVASFTGTNPRDLVVHISIIAAFYFIFILESKINETNAKIGELEKYLRGGRKNERR